MKPEVVLVIPEVRAVAGGLLASSAVLGVIIGFASQRTLGNFVAGWLIAISQPIRLGDRVSYAGEDGIVEEVGLTYTFIRTRDDARLVVPNEKLVSDTIRNASIRSKATFAEVTVQVPLAATARIRQGWHTIDPSKLQKLAGYRARIRYSESGGTKAVESIHVFGKNERGLR